MQNFYKEIILDGKIVVLCGKCAVYKTEAFIKKTRHFAQIDNFLSKLFEGVALNLKSFTDCAGEGLCFNARTKNGEHSFFFRFGKQIKSPGITVNAADVIFFDYLGKESVKRTNDQSLVVLLKNTAVSLAISSVPDISSPTDFNKLYVLSRTNNVNFPLLNEKQREIVTIEDKNVLVQGVAGSGKTNVCINKIVYSACREYTGRVLYTTYSRGLLLDTKEKLDEFAGNLDAFTDDFDAGRLVFTDENKKRAIENKLGVFLDVSDDENKIISKIKRVSTFIKNNVDYYLIEDLYAKFASIKPEIRGESYFLKSYVKNIKNHQLTSKLNKIGYLPHEIVYKEIYGLICGFGDIDEDKETLSPEEYTAIRKDSFSKPECEIIFSLAQDFLKHLKSRDFTDNNLMSRELLKIAEAIPKYSLAVVDEVQDMTQINLRLMKSISRKLFCVGDALQMINPSYFSFAYLKNLLYEKDVVSVAELKSNYRNTEAIARIIDKLGELNASKFGTHSFVLHGESVAGDAETKTVLIRGKDFMNEVAKQNFENITVVVSDLKQKEELRKILKSTEILTVSEIKGLERESVILYDVLSDNAEKWKQFERTIINRKQADENSVYRYYFNLFYVGVSRAKSFLYVCETRDIGFFSEFLKNNFEAMTPRQAVESLSVFANKIETDRSELIERIKQFLAAEQYDNARFTADKITDDIERTKQLIGIDIYEKYISRGDLREAGAAFWEKGVPDEARRYLKLSGDTALVDLFDSCTGNDNKPLDISILPFFTKVGNNPSARKLILDTVKNDLKQLAERQKTVDAKLKSIKENSNGKRRS